MDAAAAAVASICAPRRERVRPVKAMTLVAVVVSVQGSRVLPCCTRSTLIGGQQSVAATHCRRVPACIGGGEREGRSCKCPRNTTTHKRRKLPRRGRGGHSRLHAFCRFREERRRASRGCREKSCCHHSEWLRESVAHHVRGRQGRRRLPSTSRCCCCCCCGTSSLSLRIAMPLCLCTFDQRGNRPLHFDDVGCEGLGVEG